MSLQVQELQHCKTYQSNTQDSPTLPMIDNPYKKVNKKRHKPTVRLRTLPQYFPPQHRLRATLRKRNEKENEEGREDDTTKGNILGGNHQEDIIDKQLLLKFTKEENHHWGDSISVKTENTTRIYFQNINGLRAGNTKSAKWPAVVKSIADA